MNYSNLPFSEAFARLLDENDWSRRLFASKCRQESGTGWGSHMTINRIASGDYVPPLEAIEIMARVFHVDPEHFAEYRLGVARSELDPKEVGLRVALRNLDRFEGNQAGSVFEETDAAVTRSLSRDDETGERRTENRRGRRRKRPG